MNGDRVIGCAMIASALASPWLLGRLGAWRGARSDRRDRRAATPIADRYAQHRPR